MSLACLGCQRALAALMPHAFEKFLILVLANLFPPLFNDTTHAFLALMMKFGRVLNLDPRVRNPYYRRAKDIN
jgi:hypothetical protein